MLKIRLARVGKKKRPAYRFIVSESARDTYGKALEILGHYNPFTKVTEVKKDRILHWISKGAQLSPTVHNMLIDQNVIKAEKVKASKSKKKGADAESTAAPAAAEKPAETPAATEEKKEETPAAS
ncbi:MAG: 30S ribosomal protein S16 [Candidatus Buchananbacteria bacterium]|nr:30S ribosomal protein S16 [Candidatus Buchananbacteria bacterium]